MKQLSDINGLFVIIILAERNRKARYSLFLFQLISNKSMAKRVLFNIVGQIIGWLGSTAAQEIGSMWDVRNKLQDLKQHAFCTHCSTSWCGGAAVAQPQSQKLAWEASRCGLWCWWLARLVLDRSSLARDLMRGNRNIIKIAEEEARVGLRLLESVW